ncbi:unnamed protein product [Brugia pahangi]|uniref:Uncharacterized protein n=1 Tax=Brugia pahangi TaxID=6280 RepID=A0A0N4TTV0_BRUPA|nr:unnamed protein product [Brugia pahangi]
MALTSLIGHIVIAVTSRLHETKKLVDKFQNKYCRICVCHIQK